MPAWLIPYWIADMLMTLGLVLIGIGLAGLALIWLRTRLSGGRRRQRRGDGAGERFQLLGNFHGIILRGTTETVGKSDFRLVQIGR